MPSQIGYFPKRWCQNSPSTYNVSNVTVSNIYNTYFSRLYIWEILHLTIRKKNKHVIRLSTELAEAREKLRRAESRSGSSSEDEDNNKDRNREKPSEDVVERMEEKLETAQADQKNLFLIIFQVHIKFSYYRNIYKNK